MNKEFYDADIKNEMRQKYLELVQAKEITSNYDAQNFMENYSKCLKGGMN